MKINSSILMIITFSLISCNENVEEKVNIEPTPKVETQIIDKAEIGTFAHVVYFWLKNPDSEQDKNSFLESLKKYINQSPYIATKHIGTPPKSERDVVDDSFDYSLVLTFKDKTDQDLYQLEGAHQVLREEIGPLVDRFVVYDSEAVK